MQRCLVGHLSCIYPSVHTSLFSLSFLPLFRPFYLPSAAAQNLPCPRASVKVRRGLLIIASYRNIGLSWWDQPVALQGGDKAEADGGRKELQLKVALSTVP